MGLPQFSAGFPGVKQATLTPARGASSTAYVQFWRDYQIASDGEYRLSQRVTWLKGDTDAVGHLVRGDLISIDGTEYQAATDAELDSEGVVAAIYLEPLP